MKRIGLAGIAIGVAAALTCMCDAAEPPAEKSTSRLYVGTYTNGKSKGIYVYDFDSATGALSDARLAVKSVNPSFLAFHPDGRRLYAVNEISNFNGKSGGAVSAFTIDAAAGALTLINQQSSVGAGPCYIAVDKSGRNALVANYGGGSVAVLPIQAGGGLGEASCFIQHVGTPFDPSRQGGPHAHSINLSRDNRFAVAADLGLDKLYVYRFDAEAGKLTANEPAFASVKPGAGPRHFTFDKQGRFGYVINEIDSTISVFSYDSDQGRFSHVQTISTLPAGAKGNNSTAEVVMHPSGRFLYGSNRGHDSIAAFSVDAETGKLQYVGDQTQGIKEPRNFVVDPTGKWLLVGNQGADSIVVFQINLENGGLVPTSYRVELAKPVCLRFTPPAP